MFVPLRPETNQITLSTTLIEEKVVVNECFCVNSG